MTYTLGFMVYTSVMTVVLVVGTRQRAALSAEVERLNRELSRARVELEARAIWERHTPSDEFVAYRNEQGRFER